MKKLTSTMAFACLAPVLAWLGGYDFDQRGANAVAVAIATVVAAGYQWCAPWWDD